MSRLELKSREGQARICEFSTAHGVIETPNVMPVINPNLLTVGPKEMKELGVQAVITNSYIIRRNEKLRTIALNTGVHKLLDFDGPVMTDSGTFQTYVYGDFEFDNESQVEFQRRIGSDIGTIVDVFSTPDDTYGKADNAVKETHRRFVESDRGEMILSAPIQGSVYPALRRKAGRLMSQSDAEYFAIGGVVPLLESYRYDDLVDIIANVKRVINPSRPVHLFGAGHPMFIPLAVLMGVDLFDSASYVKYARDNRLLFSEGTRDLSRVINFPRWSPLHGKYTAPELSALDQDERTRLLALHNLAAVFNEIDEVKERIKQQSLWNYVEMKSMAHPALYSAFRHYLLRYAHRERSELSRKSPFFYYNHDSLKNPIVQNMKRFTAEFLKKRKKVTVLLKREMLLPQEGRRGILRQLYENHDANFMTVWNGIPVPLELSNTYPIQQYVTSETRESGLKTAIRMVSRVTGKDTLVFSDQKDLDHLGKDAFRNMDMEFLRIISEFQFGLDRGEDFITDDTELRVSRRTERIRTAQINGEIIATLRPSDGLITLTFRGAELLSRAIPATAMRISVNDDSAPFNSKGSNVFAKFVVDSDPEIRPGNEVLVENRGSLIAVGKAVLTGREMISFRRGVAVNVHQGSLPSKGASDTGE